MALTIFSYCTVNWSITEAQIVSLFLAEAYNMDRFVVEAPTTNWSIAGAQKAYLLAVLFFDYVIIDFYCRKMIMDFGRHF